MLIVCVTIGIVLAPSSPTPYILTTLYGKGPSPVGITDGLNGDIICDPNTALAVQVDPNTRGLRAVNDEGQTVSVVSWPDDHKQIVLELTRMGDTGTVWSYQAIIARNENGVTGVGGLEHIGVMTKKVHIVISIGTDRPVPTNLTLCRSTKGSG